MLTADGVVGETDGTAQRPGSAVTRPSRRRLAQWLKNRTIFGKALLTGCATVMILLVIGLAVNVIYVRALVDAFEERSANGRMLLLWQDVRATKNRFLLQVGGGVPVSQARRDAIDAIDTLMARIRAENEFASRRLGGEAANGIHTDRTFLSMLDRFHRGFDSEASSLEPPVSREKLMTLGVLGTAVRGSQSTDPIGARIEAARVRAAAQVERATRNLAVVTVLGFLLASTAALGLLWLFARHLSVRLERIDRAAARITDGDLTARLEIYADDEIGALGVHFNQMAARIAYQSRYLSRIVQLLGDPILVLDPPLNDSVHDATIRMANQVALDLLGYEESELIGQPISRVVPKRPDVNLTEVREGRSFLQGDVDVVAKSGRTFPVSFSIALLRDVDGRSEAILCSAQDITERRLAEQRKSDFVSFASHQLRTPLTAIKWMLEIASARDTNREEAASAIADARTSVDRMVGLVNDLLHVSRLESGRLKVKLETIDLAALTQSVVEEFAFVQREKSLRLFVHLGADLQPVSADRTLLRQVVLNLVSNAVKFTPADGTIDVALEMAGDALRFSVSDNGIGIPEADVKRLFAKFIRAENAVSMETEGTGLGLYIVKLAVERFDGHVWCTSKVGEGSTFTFELPAAGEECHGIPTEEDPDRRGRSLPA